MSTGNTPDSKSIRSQHTKLSVSDVDVALAAAQVAMKALAPSWDLHDSVAVNPLWGLRNQSFENAITQLQRGTGGNLLPSMTYLKERYESGDIQNADLSFAVELEQLRQESGTQPLCKYQDALHAMNNVSATNSHPSYQSFCDEYDFQYHKKLSAIVTQEVSKWLSGYFDEGQSVWEMPFKDNRLFFAWQQVAQFDQTFNRKGINTTNLITDLPSHPEAAMTLLIEKIQKYVKFSEKQWENYFYRLLGSVFGWSSYVARFEFEAERDGITKKLDHIGGLVDLLAIRMAYDVCFLGKISDFTKLSHSLTPESPEQKDTNYNAIWLRALERSYQKKLLDQLKPVDSHELENVPAVQMAFCIDVRSEVVRRHIERFYPEAQTIGFAGFFGVPISIQSAGSDTSSLQCPVLLSPQVNILEKDVGEKIEKNRTKKQTNKKMVKSISASTNSCFSFVETMWWSYIQKLLKSAIPSVGGKSLETSSGCSKYQEPDLSTLSLKQKSAFASSALTNMGLKEGLAPYVVLFGHESSSTNNPQASALDCGACAGHSGLPNARVLAGLLNDAEVRDSLEKEYGITIPKSTVFLSGVHNTTLDTVTIDSKHLGDAQKQSDIEAIHSNLQPALEATRKERASRLPFAESASPKVLKHSLKYRSQDWSEIRPEWGLAGNASFIVARRERTKGVNLWGRSFLHDYDARKDTDGSVLELILTAPMVVTNWINMQYYVSTLDPKKFGSGNKTLHNVVGGFGLVEGNGGDLLTGLSSQSVRYRNNYLHEPIRLQVLVEADTQAITKIIEKHSVVKDLVSNQWISLVAIDPTTDERNLFQLDGWIKI